MKHLHMTLKDNSLLAYAHYCSKQKCVQGIFVIVHGRGGSSKSRHEVATLLSHSGYDVLVPDMPGFGASLISKPYDLQSYADVLNQFITTLALQRIHLLGHSNGGRIAITYGHNIQRDSSLIQKLYLNNSAGIVHPYTYKKKLRKAFASGAKFFTFIPGFQFFRRCFYKAIGGHDYLDAKSPLIKQTFLNVVRASIENHLPRITAPTRIIWGEKDTYTPLSDGEHMHELIPGSEFVVCSNEKHGIHLHNPKLLVQHILAP